MPTILPHTPNPPWYLPKRHCWEVDEVSCPAPRRRVLPLSVDGGGWTHRYNGSWTMGCACTAPSTERARQRSISFSAGTRNEECGATGRRERRRKSANVGVG